MVGSVGQIGLGRAGFAAGTLKANSADACEHTIVMSSVEEVRLAVLMLVEFGCVDSVPSRLRALPF